MADGFFEDAALQRTLFYVPHEVAGLPVFGFGWLLMAMIVAAVIFLLTVVRSGGSLALEIRRNGPLWVMAVLVVTLVLPMVELRTPDGEPVGMAIRGYGVMLLLGVGSAVALAVYRGRSRGVSSDAIMSLAPWLLIGGLIGARLFFVVQYRDQFFRGEGALQTIGRLLDFTGGGLVVYGSILGGILALWLFSRHSGLRFLRLGDVIIPCLFLGIFFGRLGCLMNGCCYGGRCEEGPWALHFPPGSPVYEEQLVSGQLVGIQVEDFGAGKKPSVSERRATGRRIAEVAAGSLAAEEGILPGQRIDRIRPTSPPRDTTDPRRPAEDTRDLGLEMVVDGQSYYWAADQLPRRALPVRPAQVVSSLSALVVCGLLLLLSPWIHREGLLSAIGLAAYAVVRFGLELLRSDEPGQFGTGLTISQLVSVGVFAAAMGLMVYLLRRPASASELQASEAAPGTHRA